jgi:hypothetical protein
VRENRRKSLFGFPGREDGEKKKKRYLGRVREGAEERKMFTIFLV